MVWANEDHNGAWVVVLSLEIGWPWCIRLLSNSPIIFFFEKKVTDAGNGYDDEQTPQNDVER